MQALADKITGIEEKVKQLAQKLGEVQAENAKLQEQNRRLKNDLSVIKEKGVQIAPTVATAPITKEKSGEPLSSKKLKKEIDQYIKEIDKCIVWLEKS